MKDILINTKLIEQLKNIAGCFIWNNEETSNIIPSGFMHQVLISDNYIDNSIKECYLKSTRKLLTIMSNKPTDNNLDITLYSPYPFIIEGAFFSRESLCNKLNGVIQDHYGMWLNGKRNIKTFLDLKPYFTEYAEGFRNGFNEFENDKIKPFMPMFATQKDYSYKVFEFLKPNSTWTNRRGFTLMKGEDKYIISNAFIDGQEEGYYYRAWCLVFSQNHLFSPLFKTLSNNPCLNNESKLSINQIALKHVYENIAICRQNSNDLAKQYGHSSGEKLYQRFNFYSSRANRKGIPSNCTLKKLENKISLMESVIEIISDEFKQKAKDEVNILKSISKTQEY